MEGHKTRQSKDPATIPVPSWRQRSMACCTNRYQKLYIHNSTTTTYLHHHTWYATNRLAGGWIWDVRWFRGMSSVRNIVFCILVCILYYYYFHLIFDTERQILQQDQQLSSKTQIKLIQNANPTTFNNHLTGATAFRTTTSRAASRRCWSMTRWTSSRCTGKYWDGRSNELKMSGGGDNEGSSRATRSPCWSHSVDVDKTFVLHSILHQFSFRF